MNILSLRVSSIKGTENLKKNSDIRIEIMRMPAKYVDTDDWGKDELIQSFGQSISIEEQVNVIRKIAANIDRNQMYIQFLCDLYFDAPLKHPVRQTCAKLLQNKNIRNSVIKCLSETMQTKLEGVSAIAESHDKINEIIVSIMGCLENFPPGMQSVQNNLGLVLDFLIDAITTYLAEFNSNQLSPATKNQYFLYLHNCVQLVQSGVNYNGRLKNAILFFKIIEMYADCPMDIKINCGHIIVGNLRNAGVNLIEFLDDYLIDMHDFQTINLSLIVGFINVMNLNEMEHSFDKFLKLIEFLIYYGQVNTNETIILLAVLRGLLSFSKKLLTYKSTKSDEYLNKILESVVNFTLINLEHNIDSVRHISRDILNNLIKFLSNFNSNFAELYAILVQYTETHQSINIKCALINAFIHTNNMKTLNQNNLNLITNLDNSVILQTYENLMVKNYNSAIFTQWYDEWIQPLIRLANGQVDDISTAAFNLIKKSIKIDQNLIIKLNDDETGLDYNLKLQCFCIARKLGYFNGMESNELLFKNLIPFRYIDSLVVKSDDNISITCLKLLADTHKITELFHPTELNLIEKILVFNINCQSPSCRQDILAYFQIVCNRLHAIMFQFCNINNKTTDSKIYDYHSEFLKRLLRFLVENLKLNGNLSRRIISLKIMFSIMSLYGKLKLSDEIRLFFNTNNTINILLNSLNDSYEINKEIIVEILKFTSEFKPTDEIGIELDDIITLGKSISPCDSITAAYYLQYIVEIRKVNINPNQDVLDIPETEFYRGVLFCLDHINSGVLIAHKSLLKASKENPLYGFIFCLRHLIKNLKWRAISNSSAWRQLFKTIIKLSKELTNIVGPIVNNSSPEGHLPNDFEPIDCDALGGINDDELLRSITPQMILLCAWRTVKEVSLLLGDISLNGSIYRNESDDSGLIQVSDILEIGHHFTELLSETKHRGAFEQAYVGFSSLCQRLWGSSEEELHKLPMEWLNNLMNIISGDSEVTNEKLCATRRSAGVPFMVQALITSELQVCSSKGLQYCMRQLLDLTQHGKTSENRTHALNILRALFRCSDLGESVAEYISDGIQTSINGYDAVSWSEQNSSTLLFSSLMVRIFGVQRTRDTENLNIRNKMTGRIFFLRYPKLFDFFLNELKIAAKVINTNQRYRKLYPILLIMNRLYPSSLEGCESNLKLSQALPYILDCTGCVEMSTRILIAKTIIILIPPDEYLKYINSRIDCLIQALGQNSNLVHGILLQVFYLIKIYNTDADLSAVLQQLTSANIESMHSANLVVLQIYYDILIEILLKNPDKYQNATVLNNYADYNSAKYLIKNPNFLKSRLTLAILQNAINLNSLIPLVCDSNYELIEFVLNLLLILINENRNYEFPPIYEIDPQLIKIVKLKRDTFDVHAILSNENFYHKFYNLISVSAAYENYVTIIKFLSITKNSKLFLNLYLTNRDNPCENLKFLNNLILHDEEYSRNDYIKFELLSIIFKIIVVPDTDRLTLPSSMVDLNKTLLNLLIRTTNPENLDEVREISTKIFVHLLKLNRYGSAGDGPIVEHGVIIIKLILLLLRDDSAEIRDIIAEYITREDRSVPKEIMPNYIYIPLYAQHRYLNFAYTNLKLIYGNKQALIILLLIAAFEYIPDDCDFNGVADAECATDIKCFDKNEINIFNEKEILINDIFKLIQSDLAFIDCDDLIDESKKILTGKHGNVFAAFVKSDSFKKFM